MLLFTVGPVMMHPETLEQSGKQLPYFRTREFSDMMLESEKILKEIMGADPKDRVAFLTMSGTGAMEAAVMNVFDEKDNLLVINGGSFGERFEEICRIHKIEYESIKLGFGEELAEEHLAKYENTQFTGMLVNIDETSTGQLYDIRMISDFCKRKNMVLVVDAISSFLADEYDMKGMGIDVTIISSQKALSLEPGMSAVMLNERTYNERIVCKKTTTLYMDLGLHIRDQERGQTPFTPSVGTLITMNRMLRSIRDMGVENKVAHTRELAKYFRMKAKENGFTIPEYNLSNAVTPVLFDDGAYDVFEELMTKYDIVVTPSGGELRNRLIRVGHLGNLKKEDYDILIESMKKVVG